MLLFAQQAAARSYADNLMDNYESRYPEAARILEEGIKDSIQFYTLNIWTIEKYLQPICWRD